jgi:hypothetical protein
MLRSTNPAKRNLKDTKKIFALARPNPGIRIFLKPLKQTVGPG